MEKAKPPRHLVATRAVGHGKKVGEDYYFICHSGKLRQNGWQKINSTVSSGLPIADGMYYFGADGKLVTEN